MVCGKVSGRSMGWSPESLWGNLWENLRKVSGWVCARVSRESLRVSESLFGKVSERISGESLRVPGNSLRVSPESLWEVSGKSLDVEGFASFAAIQNESPVEARGSVEHRA